MAAEEPVVSEPAGEVELEPEEEEASFDKLFELRTPVVPATSLEEEEEEEESGSPTKKKGKKKKKHVQVEYDPDKDETIVYRKHRREGEDWD